MSIYKTTLTPSTTYTVTAGSGGASGAVLGASGSGYNWVHATADTIATSAWTSQHAAAISANGTLELKGDNADLKINGESLKETLEEIKQALKIPGTLNRNRALEQEFEELKEAAEHYEKLVKHFKEQKKVFEILKNQDL